MFELQKYALKDPSAVESPGLLYYADIIEENTRKAIEIAGGPERLWPHVKSHKTRELILMQRAMGITHFKCATTAEAQMVAECGGEHILQAYPLVGPNIRRFVALSAAFPNTAFYAIGDDLGALTALSDCSKAAGKVTKVLIDLNMGMNRTGVVLPEAEALYRAAAKLPGIEMAGLHGYDGHHHEPEFSDRARNAAPEIDAVRALRDRLVASGIPCGTLVMGGSPTFPVHAPFKDAFLSPGTVFLMDMKYSQKIHGLPFEPGAALIARCCSHPAEGLFTIDVGNKAIACEMAGPRGVILGHEGAAMTVHSEEHWVFRAEQGKERPKIGEVLYVIPAHICPTNALYAEANVVRGGEVVDHWPIASRARNIGY